MLEGSSNAPRPGPAQQSDSSHTMSDTLRQKNDWTLEDVIGKEDQQVEYAVEKVSVHEGSSQWRRNIVR